MGNKGNIYKNLKINLDEISEIINAWGIETEYNEISVDIPKDMSAQALNYLIHCDDKTATLAVFPSKGGVYSISPNFGKEKEISKSIADYIVSHTGKLADSNPYKNGLSIDVSKSDFETFYELLKEQNDVIVDEERKENENKFFARLKNQKYGDSIVISYYNTGKLVIQGKVLELFCLAVEIISEGHELRKIVNAETKSAGLTINGDDVIEDMKKSLGDAYEFLGAAHKAILAGAYVLYRTNIVITGSDVQMDYSGIFHPAARTLEGYILKQLVNNNVSHDNGEGIGYYFKGTEEKNPLSMRKKYADAVDNEEIVCEINSLYKLFHRVRHPFFHSSENDYTTSIITDRTYADKYFKEIIEAISSSYERIQLAKKK